MSEFTRYEFRIENFTPENMPFGRLLEYYSEILKMIGISEDVHLISLFEGSHGSAFKVDRNAEIKLVCRMAEINSGTAPSRSMRSFATINEMLKKDGTSGRFYDVQQNNVIEFPGKKTDENVELHLKDIASFVGELYYIAGSQFDVNVRIATASHGKISGTTSREIAKNLRNYLFEDVRVSGRGIWTRSSNGEWDISNFVINDFEPANRASIRTVVEKIRSIGIDWPTDPLAEIAHFEEESEATK